jgi:hypothetical protein
LEGEQVNKGTEIDHVIAYLEKRKSEGYTHVAVTTPDKEYDSIVYYDECTRKNEGVLRIGSSCPRCLTCFNYSKYRKEDTQ